MNHSRPSGLQDRGPSVSTAVVGDEFSQGAGPGCLSSAPRRSVIGLSFRSGHHGKTMDQQAQAAGHARLARGVQKRNPSGKPKPGSLGSSTGLHQTSWSSGKAGWRTGRLKMPSAGDSRSTSPRLPRGPLTHIVRSPPIILRGRWAESVEKTGNFVFRFAGNLSPQVIASYRDSLCSHFPAAESACVVPTTGWTWVQFRGVDIARVEGDSEVHSLLRRTS
jgi:hypothetical protein